MKHFFYLAIAVLLFSACDDDDPVIPNEEEVITTLRYTLTPVNGGDALTFLFEDLDGDGGNAPTIVAPTLAANTSYTGSLTLLNESDNAEDITEEVREEDDEHQVFYSSDVLVIDVADTDRDGLPLGLSTTATTGAAGTGTMTITLRHEPNKTAEGVADGDITNAGGETDIEVQFNVTVQ